MSQLALGAAADVSQRHISFIETGRSKPSRELVRHLGVVLDVPLRQQNVLLAAAGYAPIHTETDPAVLVEHLPALRFVVDAHAPYMAVVVDRRWNLVVANAPSRVFASRLLDPSLMEGDLNIMRATFHPAGLQRHILNWDSVWPRLLAGLERDLARSPGDEDLAELVADVRAMAGTEGVREEPTDDLLLLPLRYQVGDHRFELFTTIATIGSPLDVTVSELRIETFWPADSESEAGWRRFIAEGL